MRSISTKNREDAEEIRLEEFSALDARQTTMTLERG